MALAGALVAGCGGGGDEDPEEVLRAAFSKSTEIQSGVLDLSLGGEFEGQQSGDFNLSVKGPFQNDGENVGALDLDVNARANIPGIAALLGSDEVSIDGSVAFADGKLYVSYNGNDYVADESTADSIVPGLSDAIQMGTSAGGELDAESQDKFLEGITNLENEGTEDVAGVETIHVSGDLDLAAIAEAGGEAPVDLEGVEEASVDIYVGKDDDLVRRMDMDFEVALPAEAAQAGVESLDMELSFSVAELNEEQTIETPADAQPIENLLKDLGIAEQLGTFGMSLPGAGLPGIDDPGPAGGEDQGQSADEAPGPPSEEDIQEAEKISKCLEQAGSDPQAIQDCLTP